MSSSQLNPLSTSVKIQTKGSANAFTRRQAQFKPLSGYVEREALLQEDTVGATNGFAADHTASSEIVNVIALARQPVSHFEEVQHVVKVPLTQLYRNLAAKNTIASLTPTVSVRRGWNTRFVNRLAAQPSSILEGGSALVSLPLNATVGQAVPTNVTPFLLDMDVETARREKSWRRGFVQPLRVSGLTRLLSRLAGVPVHLIRVNSLALARFDFDRDIIRRTRLSQGTGVRSSNQGRIPTSARFLLRLEQEMGSRFSAASGRLPDLLRLGFAAIYLKAAGVLAQLLANSLARLPRNRKEIPFIRFRIKVVKVLVSARPERLGVRVSFKGRVARWNRTKILAGESGMLALYTYSSRLESGMAQAITRKGTMGVRVWLAYHPSFAKRFRSTLLAFVRSAQ